MKKEAKKASMIALLGNIFLFTIKLIAGILTNSIAVISDAINSLTDIIASIAIHISVRVSHERADKKHPFGHRRAEPIAGLIVAIFTGIVAFEILKFGIERLLKSDSITSMPMLAIVVLIVTIITKSAMAIYTRRIGKRINSPAILASSIDSRNDIAISTVALLGVIGVYFGYPYLDSVAGILISIWLFYVAYDIGKDNIDYLMGAAPSKETLKQIKKTAREIKGVIGTNDIVAHYVGNYIHVEVHIEVDKTLNVRPAHNIGKKVQKEVESLPQIDKAFIHIDSK